MAALTLLEMGNFTAPLMTTWALLLFHTSALSHVFPEETSAFLSLLQNIFFNDKN